VKFYTILICLTKQHDSAVICKHLIAGVSIKVLIVTTRLLSNELHVYDELTALQLSAAAAAAVVQADNDDDDDAV